MMHLEMGVGERCEEWPSPRSFEFYVCRGLPATCVKATVPGRLSLPLRNSGGRLWRRNWIVRERQNEDIGVFSPRAQRVLAFAPWAVVTLPDQCPSHHPVALCPWELGLCISCHHPLPPHVMWGREQHLYSASIRTQLFICARAPAKHKAILKYCTMVQTVGFLAFLPWL